MAENHVIVAGYAAGGYTKTRPAFQYDYGQELQLQGFPEGMLPASFEMHFSIGMGQAITRIGTDGAVAVPNACLERFGTLTAWLFLHDAETDGETKYVIEIPVRSRAKTTDQEPTPAEQSVITEAIAALNAGVTAAEAAQAAAEAAAESVGEAAEQAQGKAGEAAASAAAAAGSAEAAAGSATSAAGAATFAGESASAAAGSATAASGSAEAAAGSATAAAGSAAAAAQTVAGIEEAGAAQVLAVNTAGAAKVDAINTAGTEKVNAINTAGTEKVNAVNTAGAAQVQAVEAKGEEVIEEIPADYSALSADVTNLKSALNALESAAVKSVNDIEPDENGNVDVEIADPEEIHSAVGDWLDEHPEATTTVEDGSITQTKISGSFLPKIKNNYVTPEMFGAVGDGATDDTEAINDALSSGYNVFFSNKTYMTSGAIVSSYIRLYFDNTILKANTNYQEYLLKVQGQIFMDGHLTANGNYKAMNGVIFNSSYGSVVNRITAQYINAWGVVVVSSGHMTFDYINTAECGIRTDFTVSYQSDYVVKIDSTLNDRTKETLKSQYCFETFLYDKSDYDASFPGKRFWRTVGFDEDTQTINLHQQAQNKMPSDYLSKSCRLCMGGGVLIGTSNNGQINIGIVDTKLGPIGIGIASPYGHYIGSYYSQNDSIPVAVYNYCLGGYYGSVTMEAPDSGHSFVCYNYDYSVIVTKSTNYDYPLDSKETVRIGGSGFSDNPILLKTIARKVMPSGYRLSVQPTITEKTNDTYVIMRNTSIKINLYDTYGDGFTKGQNPWVVKTLYFMPDSNLTGDFTITLDASLIEKGYSIENGQSGTLIFQRPSRYFKMLIFLQEKKFIVFTESITPQAANAT